MDIPAPSSSTSWRRDGRPRYNTHYPAANTFGEVMADQGRWFKLWVSSKDDPHLSVLSISDFGRWCKLGTYLKVHGTDGIVMLATPADPLIVHPLQSGFQVATFAAVIDAISRFPNCTISSVTSETITTVTYKIEWRNWSKYQGDFSGDRVRKYRTKKADVVTAKKRREEMRRDEIRRENKDICPEVPISIGHGTANGSCPEEWQAVKAHLQTLTWLNRPELYDWEFWTHLDTSLSAFPDISVVDELSKAEAWLMANPRKAKTKKRWKAFLLNWFHFSAERKARYEKGQVGRS